MSILVYIESNNGAPKKSSLEAVSFAKTIANSTSVFAVCTEQISDNIKLAAAGADEIINVSNSGNSSEGISAALVELASAKNANLVVLSSTYAGKSIAPRVSVKLNAALATNVIDYPNTTDGFKVKRGVFSGKAFAWVSLTTESKVLLLTPNSFEVNTHNAAGTVSEYSMSAAASSRITVTGINKAEGKIPLTEAELVVSGGRGMKGPENWGLIEDLATALGAATACSKPVSDMHWRPHSEHVGQTGITIKPNLYIAVGISGAIQHLAGVSSSKVIVAINKDPEAPFFKAADYGIIGDALEILPKLTEAVKNL